MCVCVDYCRLLCISADTAETRFPPLILCSPCLSCTYLVYCTVGQSQRYALLCCLFPCLVGVTLIRACVWVGAVVAGPCLFCMHYLLLYMDASGGNLMVGSDVVSRATIRSLDPAQRTSDGEGGQGRKAAPSHR